MQKAAHTCEERVFRGGSFHGFVCRKPAKFEKDGKHYCGVHNPERLQAIRERNDARYNAEFASQRAKQKAVDEKNEELKRRYDLHDELRHSLSMMTGLCRLKYGNLDKDVYQEIERAEALLAVG